jgi:hypothetical protein
MSLRDYAVARDNFCLDPLGYTNTMFSFPCCVCRNKLKEASQEPCRTCDHNINAVRKQEPHHE